jgi:hypothetical protein
MTEPAPEPAPVPAPVIVRPLQWAALPDLGDALPLDASDLACMEELRAVLARHGKLDRFALHLAHKHFELGEGEVLVERPDGDGRTQHVTVGKLADYPDALPTTWLLDDGPALRLSDAVYCVCQAVSPYALGACAIHGKSPSPAKPGQLDETLKEQNHQREKAKKEVGWPVGGHDRRIERDH